MQMPENTHGDPVGEVALIEQCLGQLTHLDGFRAQLIPEASSSALPELDGHVRLSGPWGQVDYALEVKRSIRPDTLRFLTHHNKSVDRAHGVRLLLMAHYISPELGSQLRSQSIDYVDTAGNMSLVNPPLFVWVEGRRSTVSPPRTSRLFQSTGLRLIATLLHLPDALQWTYRELSERSGVSLGAIGYLLEELQEKGYARLRGSGQLQLVEPGALLHRWEEGYTEQLRPRLFIKTCRPVAPARQNRQLEASGSGVTRFDGLETEFQTLVGPELELLCRRIVESGLRDKIRVGGELGAALLTGHLRPARATLHLAETDHRQSMTALRLIPDPTGSIDLIRFMGGEPSWPSAEAGGVRLASPQLIHAELMRSTESDRLREIAQLVAERYLR